MRVTDIWLCNMDSWMEMDSFHHSMCIVQVNIREPTDDIHTGWVPDFYQYECHADDSGNMTEMAAGFSSKRL